MGEDDERENLVSADARELDDDHGGCGLSEAKLDKRVEQLLKTLRAKPTSAGSGGDAKEGWLYKRKRKAASWRRVYARLDPQRGTLAYHKVQDGGRAQGVLALSFVSLGLAGEADELAQQQHQKGENVCKYRLNIFSTHRHYLFSAESDDEAKAWNSAIDSVVRARYSSAEYDEKKNAVKELAPLMAEQETVQLERYAYLRSVLAQSGFISTDGPSKLKEGYMKLRLSNQDGSWRKYYWVLDKKYVSYYLLEDKTIPHGIIALKFIVSVEPVEGDGGRRLLLTTPLRKYLIRCKHDVAMTEWVNALRQAKAKREKQAPPALLDLPAEEGGTRIDGAVQLVSVTSGKTKRYTLSKETNTIGRASSNDIKLNDTKVSRNHAKVEMKGGVPIFFDLGSSRGSKVNNERVNTKALRVGDKIKIGNCILTVEVKR